METVLPATAGVESDAESLRRARRVLAWSAAATLVLYLVPYGRFIAYPLLLLSTLAHEMGHGVAALLVGGQFHSFRLWADGSGVAAWSGRFGRLAFAFVAAGGLLGPAVAAAGGFVLGRTPRRASAALMVAGALLVVAEVAVVRNLFGWLFVALAAAAFLWLGVRAPGWLAQGALLFVSAQLALSVFSRSDYLFTAVAETADGRMPSDVAQIASALFLPYWFWGALCGALSLAVLFLGLRLSLSGPAPAPGGAARLPSATG